MAGLWVASRGKWSDPIIDSGREWIVPDALARGELLYRDVVYWFGPFTPYFQAVFLRVFGPGFGSLVLSGAVASLGMLLALYLAVRRVAGRLEAAYTTALAIPVLVFMPNAGGSLMGMGFRIWHAAAFSLLAIAVACRPPRQLRGDNIRMAAAGGLAALSGLCRTEWGVVSLASVVMCRMRLPRRKSLLAETGLAGGGFVAIFGGVLGFFLAHAGSAAVLRDSHVLLTGLPKETRSFVLTYSGIGNWRIGLLELLYSSGMWLGTYLAVALIATRSPGQDWPRGRIPSLLALLALLGLIAIAGGIRGAEIFSAAPLICLGALGIGLRLLPGSRSAALSAFGLNGLLLSYRRPFHIGDTAYVGPPLLFALVCGAGLLHLTVLKEERDFSRRRLRTALSGGLLVLAAVAFVGRAFQYATKDVVTIPGTDGMLSARSPLVSDLTELALAIRATAAEGGLVVFPEGEILNKLSGRRNPVRHKLYIPGYLTTQNESEILGELERSRPATVVILPCPTFGYGPATFGVDYGSRILSWIEENYSERPWQQAADSPVAGARLYVAKRSS